MCRKLNRLGTDQIEIDRVGTVSIPKKCKNKQCFTGRVRNDRVRYERVSNDRVRYDRVKNDRVRSDWVRYDRVRNDRGLEMIVNPEKYS